MILGVSLMSIKGFAAAEVEEVYERALALCARQGASSQAFMVHWLLGLFHYFRAELQPCLAIVDQLLQSANDLQDPQFVIEAQRAYGVTLVDLGRFGESMEHLDEVPPLRATHPRPAHGAFPGQDPEVAAESYAARALWALGYPDQALARVNRAHVGRTRALAPGEPHRRDLLRGAPPSASGRSAGGAGARGNRRRAGRGIRSGGVDCAGTDEPRLGAGRAGIGGRGSVGARAAGLPPTRRREPDSGGPYFLGLLAQALARADRTRGRARGRGARRWLPFETQENRASAAELHRVHGELLLATAASGCRRPGDGLFHARAGDRAGAAGQVLGAEGGHEPLCPRSRPTASAARRAVS